MKPNVSLKSAQTAPDEVVWAFDLGIGSIGEVVRCGTEFLHKASLLISTEFTETKTAAGCGARVRRTSGL